jgi:SAM-dependent methyltransferase
MNPSGRDQFITLMRSAVADGSLVKLTLGKPKGSDPTLRNLFVRPVVLKSGAKLAFVWRHATRDVTKNYGPEEAIGILEPLVGTDFLDAHLFTATGSVQLETGSGTPRIRIMAQSKAPAAAGGNDRSKTRSISSDAPWLRALGVTDPIGRPMTAMADKFRQIQKFSEILSHLLKEAPLPTDRRLQVFDMGCGKGYLTFAACELLGERAQVHGVEVRAELVAFCNRTAAEQGLADHLSFVVGTIEETNAGFADVLIALHACDTATDDALAKGVSAGAALIVVAPCCQKEIRPQIVPPEVLAPALRHGIFVERQAEFVTDALRALLLEWAGYSTRVMEFISTEHTAKNTMISAVKAHRPGNGSTAKAIREFAAFYGVRHHTLARHLGFEFQ